MKTKSFFKALLIMVAIVSVMAVMMLAVNAAVAEGYSYDSKGAETNIKWVIDEVDGDKILTFSIDSSKGSSNTVVASYGSDGTFGAYNVFPAPWSEYRVQISKVIFGEGITKIDGPVCGEMANLDEVILPSTLETIGHFCFASAQIKQMIVPASVTTLEDYSFNGATCLKLVIMGVPDFKDHKQYGAFAWFGATSGIWCSMDCSLMRASQHLAPFIKGLPKDANVETPSVDTTKSDETTKQQEEEVDPTNPIIASGSDSRDYTNMMWSIDKDGVLVLTPVGAEGWNQVPYFKEAGDSDAAPWLKYADKITKVVVGDFAKIGSRAIYKLPNLEVVELSEKVGQLAHDAIIDCPKLKTIYVKGNTPVEGVADLSHVEVFDAGTNIVSNCPFTSIIFSDAMKSITANAITKCAYLTNVTLGANIESVDADAFSGCYNLAVVFGTEGTAAKQFADDNDLTFATVGSEVDIPEAVITEAPETETNPPETTEKAPETTEKTADTTKKQDSEATQTGDINLAMVVAFAVAALGTAVVVASKKRSFN